MRTRTESRGQLSDQLPFYLYNERKRRNAEQSERVKAWQDARD